MDLRNRRLRQKQRGHRVADRLMAEQASRNWFLREGISSLNQIALQIPAQGFDRVWRGIVGRRQVLVGSRRGDTKVESQSNRSSGFQYACGLAKRGFLIVGSQML